MVKVEHSAQRTQLRTPSTAKTLAKPANPCVLPWSVDRWGRLIAGTFVLLFTLLGLLHQQFWLFGSLTCAVNLVLTSVTDRCMIRRLLMRLGAREREELFLPGGMPRQPEAEKPSMQV